MDVFSRYHWLIPLERKKSGPIAAALSTIEWLGARGTQVTFSGKISFHSKVPEFLHVPFNLVEKHSLVCFWGLNALVQLCCVHCARFDILSSFFSKTKCKPAKKIHGECFTTSSKSTSKHSGTFEGKQILPKKVTYVPLAPSHSIEEQ